jgi:hypothetical protein
VIMPLIFHLSRDGRVVVMLLRFDNQDTHSSFTCQIIVASYKHGWSSMKVHSNIIIFGQFDFINIALLSVLQARCMPVGREGNIAGS